MVYIPTLSLSIVINVRLCDTFSHASNRAGPGSGPGGAPTTYRHECSSVQGVLLSPTIIFLQVYLKFLGNKSLFEKKALPIILGRMLVISRDFFIAKGQNRINVSTGINVRIGRRAFDPLGSDYTIALPKLDLICLYSVLIL